MTKISLEHIIRQIAEGRHTPSEDVKVSLEHAIRHVHEAVGNMGTDKFQGTQFKNVRSVTPHISPKHHTQAAETASKMRSNVKEKGSMTLHGKVAEEGVSELGGATSQVASWPATEDGKKIKKIKEEVSGTKDREEIEFTVRKKDSPERKDIKYVGRPDSDEPKSKKSILGRTGAVRSKIDEVRDETVVDFQPKLNTVNIDSLSTEGGKNIKLKKIVKKTIKEASLGGIVSKGFGGLSALDAASNLKQGKVGKAALSGLGMASGPIGAAAGASDVIGSLATGTETGRSIGKWIGDNVPGAKTAADVMRKAGEAIGVRDKSPEPEKPAETPKPASQEQPKPIPPQHKPFFNKANKQKVITNKHLRGPNQ